MQNDITGEHTCIMLKALQTEEVESLSEGGANWVQPFFQGNPPAGLPVLLGGLFTLKCAKQIENLALVVLMSW
jgi:hypothetical protein